MSTFVKKRSFFALILATVMLCLTALPSLAAEDTTKIVLDESGCQFTESRTVTLSDGTIKQYGKLHFVCIVGDKKFDASLPIIFSTSPDGTKSWESDASWLSVDPRADRFNWLALADFDVESLSCSIYESIVHPQTIIINLKGVLLNGKWSRTEFNGSVEYTF